MPTAAANDETKQPYWGLPTRLFLVRHGESEGNINRALYATKADSAMRLTGLGVVQAQKAGRALTVALQALREQEGEAFGALRVWNSSYTRARETAFHILHELGRSFDFSEGQRKNTYKESDLIVEQMAGTFDGQDRVDFAQVDPTSHAQWEKFRKEHADYYARPSLGESRAEVDLRIRAFLDTAMRDRARHDIRNIVIVTHGVTMRSITKKWMEYPFEWTSAERNPPNCAIRLIEGCPKDGYFDRGYIHGEGIVLNDPMALQRKLQDTLGIFMLKPQRPGTIVPQGVVLRDPFSYDKE